MVFVLLGFWYNTYIALVEKCGTLWYILGKGFQFMSHSRQVLALGWGEMVVAKATLYVDRLSSGMKTFNEIDKETQYVQNSKNLPLPTQKPYITYLNFLITNTQ